APTPRLDALRSMGYTVGKRVSERRREDTGSPTAKVRRQGGEAMFGVGPSELIIILVLALIIFGPGKLPEVGKAVGRSIREFKAASSAVEDNLKQVTAPTPPPAPAQAQTTQEATVAQASTAGAASETTSNS